MSSDKTVSGMCLFSGARSIGGNASRSVRLSTLHLLFGVPSAEGDFRFVPEEGSGFGAHLNGVLFGVIHACVASTKLLDAGSAFTGDSD